MTALEQDSELNLIGSILNDDDEPVNMLDNHVWEMSPGQRTPNHMLSMDNLSMPTDPTCPSMYGRSQDSYRFDTHSNQRHWKGSVDEDSSPRYVMDFCIGDAAQEVTPSRNRRRNAPAIEKHFMSERALPKLNLIQSKSRQFQYRQEYHQTFQYPTQMEEISEDIQLTTDMDNLCGNQILSRKIQKLFEHGRQDQKDLIFNKIERSYMQYAKDIFGNYIVQKVIEKGTQQQKLRLFNKLRQHFYDLSKHNFGCRVIQKILECTTTEPNLQDKFLEQIQAQVKSLLYDVYGNYVILKCLDTVPKQKLAFILPPILDSIPYMVQQTYGCRILQKVMEIYDQEEISKITKQTIQLCHILCQSEYGNYIIQHVLKSGPAAEQEILANLIKSNFYILSLNKYGSNTVEKYIEIADRESLKDLTGLMLRGTQEPFFLTLATHPFGNYVFKKYIVMCDAEILEPILTLIRQAPVIVSRVRASEYGQRVYQVLEKLML